MFIAPVLSAIASIGGAFVQAGQQQAAAQAQANAAYYNAAVAQNNANAAMQAAYANKLEQDRKNRAQLATVQSKYLGSGVELEGTPGSVLLEEAAQGALESDKLLYQGKVQYANYMNQAQLDTYQGDVAQSAGSSQASGTILGGLIGGASTVGKALYTNNYIGA